MSDDIKTTATEAAKNAGKPSRSTSPKPPAKARGSVGVPKPPKAKGARKPVGTPVATGAPIDATLPVDTPELKKQELLAKVVERTDVKKKFAKPVVEAMLAILGEELAEGREMNLQPLGKIKHNRTKDTPNAKVIIVKIRQKKLRDDMVANNNQSIADTDEGR